MKNCEECGKEFKSRKTGGYPQLVCSRRCNDQKTYRKRRSKIIQQKHVYYREKHPLLPKKECSNCGEIFQPDRIVNKYCKKECKNRGSHKEKKEYYNRKTKEWFVNHPEYRNEYARNSRRYNLSVRLSEALRNRLRRVLEGKIKKVSSARKLLGCTIEELWIHLEKQFQPGMTRENRALRGWHVDHIKPINLFDLSEPEQQRQAFHYKNLQPLWWRDNLTKPKKYEKSNK